MLDLKDVFYFVQVVDRGGFSAASRGLNIPKSTLSHRIRQLETFLEVRLVNRTSRRFTITDLGREFYARALILLDSAEAAEQIVRQQMSEPSGTIRITTPAAIAQFLLSSLIPAFLDAHPKVTIVQHTTDVPIDIVADGFDLALRGHSQPLTDSTLIKRTIAHVPWHLYAGATYMRARPKPRTLCDLAKMDTIAMPRDALVWNLRGTDARDVEVHIKPRYVSNDMIALKQTACLGLGIVALPAYVCAPEVADGRLVRILPDWTEADSYISALMPYRQNLRPAVRAFVDHIAAELPKVVASTA